MKSLERISIVGLGKLGAPMAAAVAAKGVYVIGVDTDERKVSLINQLEPPVYEPGLEETLKRAAGRLKATTDLQQAVLETQATFIVVATPSQSDGHFSLEYVLTVCQALGEALRLKDEKHIVIITSTVSPLSMDERIRPFLEEVSGKRMGVDFGLAYNPEFIALGTVIRDFLNPDLVLIGESDEWTGNLLEDFYRRILESRPSFARMNFVNAEITKLAINTYVTTKISFANMIARLCERLPGANVDIVSDALGRDSRIGPKYLKGAISYGGPCFPRDNLALIAIARRFGINASVAETTDAFNRQQNRWLGEFVYGHLMPEETVGILGLAYKAGSDVVEESPSIYLIHHLLEKGAKVIAYDPAAQLNARRIFGESVWWADSAEACIEQASVVVVCTAWPEFRSIGMEVWERGGRRRKVIDCWRYLSHLARQASLEYIPLGNGIIPTAAEVPLV
ncbi:MAG: nucleotide sugar dehydrogenase [Bacteroidia bacterium]|nr:nucleotide sugar dehydrogenase [Bacteroidia bacterium]MDW8015682.1 nucleotide sugar dehydrogenase [Bacteroidia bacterium]